MIDRLPRAIGREIFGTDPSGYDDARLPYPQELYRAVFSQPFLPARPEILEIGAGTGLATRDLLLRRPRKLVAIEPDEQMAGRLRNKLAETSPELEIVQSEFGATDLENEAFDLAVAAASFHWLEPITTLTRIRSALRPGGTIALWWNVYRVFNVGDAFADEVRPLLRNLRLPPSEAASGHHSLDERWHRTLLSACGYHDIEHTIFRRDRQLNALEMRRLYSSYSFVRALPEPESEALLNSISNLVETRYGGLAPNTVFTPLYLGRKL